MSEDFPFLDSSSPRQLQRAEQITQSLQQVVGLGDDSESSGEFAKVDEEFSMADLGRPPEQDRAHPFKKQGTIIERPGSVNSSEMKPKVLVQEPRRKETLMQKQEPTISGKEMKEFPENSDSDEGVLSGLGKNSESIIDSSIKSNVFGRLESEASGGSKDRNQSVEQFSRIVPQSSSKEESKQSTRFIFNPGDEDESINSMDEDGVEIVHMHGSQVVFTDSDDDDVSAKFGAQMFTGAQLADSNKTSDTAKGEADPQGEFFNKIHFNQGRTVSPSVEAPAENQIPSQTIVSTNTSILAHVSEGIPTTASGVLSQIQFRAISVACSTLKKDCITADDIHEGYLEKQSPSFHKRWQKRYFVMNNRLLKYYKAQSDFQQGKPPKGVINFEQIWVQAEFKEESLKIDLAITGSNRVFNLRAQSKEVFDSWMLKLAHSISQSGGAKKQLTMKSYVHDISKYFDFWRFLRVSEDAFKQVADVGDIILCQTKKFQLKQQGSSNVDRICLVVKLAGEDNRSEELFILRVGNNLQQPIILQSWDEFRIHKSQKYRDCWFRHLYFNRDEKFFSKTQKFIERIMERPYVTENSADGEVASPNGQARKIRRLHRNAELIAKYYKYIEVLPKLGDSYKYNFKYETKDFTQNSKFNLGLQNNASLGDENILMFNEKELTEKLKHVASQKQQQHQAQILKTKNRLGREIGLSVIQEQDIEQSIKMQRRVLDDPCQD